MELRGSGPILTHRSEGVELSCGRSLVWKGPLKEEIITPEELGQTLKRDSLSMHWLGDSDGQKRDGDFLQWEKEEEKGRQSDIWPST